jgi:hypothetical protein
VCPSVQQNKIDTYRLLIEDGKYTKKWTCSTNGLYVFWKKNHPNLCVFWTKMIFLQLYVNFIISLYSTEPFLDQTECILDFLMSPLFECHSWDTFLNSLILGGQMAVETVLASLCSNLYWYSVLLFLPDRSLYQNH